MGLDQELPFGQRKTLGHCPQCMGRLIYMADSVWYEAEVLVARRCPECELRETVVVSALHASVWYRHDTRILGGFLRLADSLRDEADSIAAAETGRLTR
jgi:hypothetical protein